MKRIELLSPAGDLERLKYAIRYGADAVYIGGKHYSLRSAASNFTIPDIKEGCEFAHKHNAKVYVTCNIVMHENDLDGLEQYLKDLEACGVDAIIASSPTILTLVKKKFLQLTLKYRTCSKQKNRLSMTTTVCLLVHLMVLFLGITLKSGILMKTEIVSM